MAKGLYQWVFWRSEQKWQQPTQLCVRQLLKTSSWISYIVIGKRWVLPGEVCPLPGDQALALGRLGCSLTVLFAFLTVNKRLEWRAATSPVLKQPREMTSKASKCKKAF